MTWEELEQRWRMGCACDAEGPGLEVTRPRSFTIPVPLASPSALPLSSSPPAQGPSSLGRWRTPLPGALRRGGSAQSESWRHGGGALAARGSGVVVVVVVVRRSIRVHAYPRSPNSLSCPSGPRHEGTRSQAAQVWTPQPCGRAPLSCKHRLGILYVAPRKCG